MLHNNCENECESKPPFLATNFTYHKELHYVMTSDTALGPDDKCVLTDRIDSNSAVKGDILNFYDPKKEFLKNKSDN